MPFDLDLISSGQIIYLADWRFKLPVSEQFGYILPVSLAHRNLLIINGYLVPLQLLNFVAVSYVRAMYSYKFFGRK